MFICTYMVHLSTASTVVCVYVQMENVAKIADVLKCSLERQLSASGGYMHKLNSNVTEV